MAIIAVGHAIMDLFFEVEVELLETLELEPGSMTLIDSDTSQIVLSHLDLVKCASGGSAANTAVGVSAFGVTSYFAGVLGSDDFGRAYRDDLGVAGVIFTDPASVHTTENTGHCIVLITSDGQRTMLTHLGASVEIAQELPELDYEDLPLIVYLEGYLLDSPGGSQMIEKLIIERSPTLRIALSLSDSNLVARHKDELWKILNTNGVSILFGNRDEYFELTDSTATEDAIEKLGRFVEEGAMTRGREGSIVFSRDEMYTIGAIPTAVLDTTGAGDLFAAGYLVGVEKGLGVIERGELGTICASEVISHIGARPQTDLKSLSYRILGQR